MEGGLGQHIVVEHGASNSILMTSDNVVPLNNLEVGTLCLDPFVLGVVSVV